ncbi:g7804 [Coccomyxa viridis]|uniref:G7804 protein n=1 Tax=Coccomyxa viridis TaxID=1274662 RepID=A0ABP1FZX3_9CHLO
MLVGKSGSPLALVVYNFFNKHQLYVSDVVVDKKYVRCGLGTKLLVKLWFANPTCWLFGLVRTYNSISMGFCEKMHADWWWKKDWERVESLPDDDRSKQASPQWPTEYKELEKYIGYKMEPFFG